MVEAQVLKRISYTEHRLEYPTANTQCRMTKCNTLNISTFVSTFDTRHSMFVIQKQGD
jgi:hypothetical protein